MTDKPVAARTAPDEKIDLLTQILVIENYVERLEIHERYANDRGMALGTMLTHELRTLRVTVKTLELMRLHEKQFVEIVKTAAREARAAQADGLSKGSKAKPTTL
jgi:hypothetical protein